MTQLLITGGLVAIEDGAKHDPADQYSLSRKARVELKFDVAEGSDPKEVLAIVADMAGDRLNAILGRAVASTVRTTDVSEGNVEPAKRTRRTKAEIEADKVAAENPTLGGPTGQPVPEPGSSPSVEDEWSTPAVAPPVKEITDAELAAATTKKNGELNDPPLIRTLIASFNPDPMKGFTLAEIPQAQRPDYLKKLAELTK